MKRAFPYIVLAILLAALIAGAVVLRWAGNDEARISRLNAVFNYGLLVGAAVAALGLFEQVSEARRSRQDGLRPLLIVADALPEPEEDESPARLVLKNIGPGPALNVQVTAWVAGDLPVSARAEIEAFIAEEGLKPPEGVAITYPWPLDIAAGARVSVPVWVWGRAQVRVPPGARLRFRVAYTDVFGTLFSAPATEELGHVWVRDHVDYGDYELHFS